MSESARVQRARAQDRAELQAVVQRLVQTPQDMADWRIAEFEAATGMMATDEDRALALRDALAAPTDHHPRTP